MRRNIINFYKIMSVSIVLFLIASCVKDGAIGPRGERGEQGQKGDQGIPGIKGKDGNFLLSGSSNPTIAIGKLGDFYLNKSTSMLFGPKLDSGWGDGFSLKGNNGANGQTGPAGAEILHGENAPANTLGKVGDFYFDTRQVVFYGPKTEARGPNGEVVYDWGGAISIRPDNAANVLLKRFNVIFDYNISLVGNEIEAFNEGHIYGWLPQENKSADNIFMEYYYTVEQANVSYPLTGLERKWNKLVLGQSAIEDVKINSAQSLKNVKLTFTVEKKDDPYVIAYNYSCKLNATVPTPDFSTISGSFVKILVKIHNVSPARIGKENPTDQEIKRFLRIKD